MTRDHYKTVTSKESFALLIRSYSPDGGTEDGTFLPPITKKEANSSEVTFLSNPVRAVTLQEIRKAAREMRGAEGDRFYALLALKGALESKDEVALAKVKERMERVYQVREREYAKDLSLRHGFTTEEMSRIFPFGVGLPEFEALEFNLLKNWPDLQPGPRAHENASRLLAYALSERVSSARIVLWWAAGNFTPAIYCEDIETCIYVHTFIVASGGRIGWRICPHCTEPFFQKKPNQDYCIPAHREAHRVARFRSKKKLNAPKSKTDKGESNGTQKTR